MKSLRLTRKSISGINILRRDLLGRRWMAFLCPVYGRVRQNGWRDCWMRKRLRKPFGCLMAIRPRDPMVSP